jgi:hypothetical protein
MWDKSCWIIAALIAVLPGSFPCAAEAGSFVPDQRNQPGDPTDFVTLNASSGPSHVGQTFKPTLSSLDVVQLWMKDLGPFPSRPTDFNVAITEVKNDGTLGKTIATSKMTHLGSLYNGRAEFDFSAPVNLDPKAVNGFGIELNFVSKASDNWGVGDFGRNPYPRGVEIGTRGNPVNDRDLWFAEGPAVLPEPSALLLFGTGVLGLLGYKWYRWKATVSECDLAEHDALAYMTEAAIGLRP